MPILSNFPVCDDLEYNPSKSYPASSYCVHRGALWVNTSGGTVQGVEPGTDYNKWNVTYSNENLLDNPWFTVNQRGQSEYTGFTYTVDRFQQNATESGKTKLKVLDSGIQLLYSGSTGFANVYQSLPTARATESDTLTFSIKLADGRIFSATGTGRIAGFNIAPGVVANAGFDGMAIILWSTEPQTPVMRAVKLELGPFSTLANDSAPDYATELAKCQRYGFSIPYSVAGFAHAYDQNNAYVNIVTPAPLRNPAALSISGFGDLRITNTNFAVEGARITSVSSSNSNSTFVSFFGRVNETLVPGTMYILTCTGSAYVSADL